MRYVLTLMMGALGTGAQAHPGHLADLAGHDHWVAGAAIAIAGLIALIEAAKGKKAAAATEDRDETPEEDGEPA